MVNSPEPTHVSRPGSGRSDLYVMAGKGESIAKSINTFCPEGVDAGTV
jgi:hypothetical protein